MTEDRKSQYIVQIGNESQMWDADKLTKNSERLASSHPEAQVYQLDDYDLSETPSPDYSYIVNIGGETQQWDAAKLDKNKDKLFAKYPDAKVQKVSAWKNPYLKSESQVAKENLDAFRAENGSFLDDFEARDTAERKMATANAMKGIVVPPTEGGISGEERGRYLELSKQEEDLKKAYYNSPDIVNARLQRGESISTMQKDIEKALASLNENTKAYAPRNRTTTLSGLADENKEDRGNYVAAQKLLNDAIKINNAPSRYVGNFFTGIGNFFKGTGDTFSNVDFWTAGLTEIAENFKIRDVLSTVQEKLGSLNDLSEQAIDDALTDSEKKVLTAYLINADVQLDRAEDLSRAFQAGQGAAESAGFMAEFILTGGWSTGARKVVKAGAKKVLGDYLGKLAGKVSKTAVGKYGRGLAGDAIEAAARTLVMPSTYRNMSQQAIQIKEDPETGERKFASVSDYVAKGFADSFIEALAEGGRVGAIGGFFGDILGSIKPAKKLIDTFKKSDIATLVKTLNNTEALSLLRAGGWHGIGEEYLEEWYGAALRTITNLEPEALKDFATVDNQLITLTSFLPMTIIGGGFSTGRVLKAKKDVEKNAALLKSAMAEQGYSEEQANLLVDSLKNAPMQALSDTFTPMIIKLAEQNDDAPLFMKYVARFAFASAKAQAFGAAYEMQEARQRDNLRTQIEETTGKPFWQEDTEGNRFVETAALGDGTPIFILNHETPTETPTEQGTSILGPSAMGIDENGNVHFVNDVESEVSSLDDYLNARLMERRGAAERERILLQTEQRINDIKSQIVLNQTVLNMGTQENPIEGLVVGMTANGVMVRTQEGATPLKWDEVGNKLSLPNTVMTDAQIEEAEVANMDAQQAAREAMLDEQFDDPVAEETEIAEGKEAEAAAEEATYNYPRKADGSVDGNALWNENVREWIKWNNQRIAEKYGVGDNGADSINYLQNQIASLEKSAKQIANNKNKETDFDKKVQLEDNEIAVNKRLAELRDILAEVTVGTAEEAPTESAPEVSETPSVNEDVTEETMEPSQSSARQTVIDLYNDAELTEDEIEEYIKANLRKAQPELDKHASKAPKMGTDIAKYKADKAKHAQKTAELEQQRNFWKEVQSYVEVPTTQFDMEPQNALEFTAKELASKEGIKLLPDSFKRHTGWGSEIGKFLSILRTKEKGGLTLEAAGERLMELDRENSTGFFDQSDPNAGLNAILDVLGGARTSGDISSYIKANREQTAKEEVAAARNAMMEEVATDVEGQQSPTNNAQFEYYEGDMSSLVEESKATSQGLIKKIISPASERLISDLNNEGVSIDSSYNHTIDNSGVRHILKQHGTSKEYKRGQIPITEDDFLLIEDIINNYDEILTEQNKRGQDVIVYVKSYPDGTTYYVEEVRVGRKELAADSMYKRKNRLTDANGNETTQISDLSVPESSSSLNSDGSLTEAPMEERPDLVPTSENESSEDKDSNIVESAIESEEKVEDDFKFESSLDEDMPDFTSSASAYFPTAEIRKRFSILKVRINDWAQKLGVKVRIMETLDDVVNQSARRQILMGYKVFGFFDVSSGEVAIYLPDYLSFSEADALSEIDKTYIHEVVSHRGLRGLLGEEKYGELCDKVWEAMTDTQRQRYLNYPGVNGNTRAAADEFIANFAESVNYEDNRTMWDKIVDFIKNLFNSVEIPVQISNESMADLLRASYNRLNRTAKAATNGNVNNQAEGNTLFRSADGSLVGMHNISEDKLRKVIKQGGLANPSTAVVNIAEYLLEGYGDISLVMPSSLVDPDTGDNVGTYSGDAWTPVYPPISRQVGDEGWKTIKDRIRSAIGELSDLYSDIVNGVNNYLDDNRTSKLEFVFLKEKGIEPAVKYKGADGLVGIRNLEAILGVEGLREGWDSYEKYKAASPMAKRSFNMWVEAGGNKAEHRKLREMLKKEPKLAEVMELSEDLSFARFDSFTYHINKTEREAGKIDTYDTMSAAAVYVDANNLRPEFEQWLESLMQEAGAKEVFFAGYTRDGDRIYKDNTLENVSRHMSRQGRTNTYDDKGLSATKSALLERFTSLTQVRRNKGRLRDERTYNKEYDALRDRLYNIISQISDMEAISSNPFLNLDYAESRLQDALTKRNPIAYLNKEYGYKIDPTGAFAEELKSFIKDVQKMPAKYFETKFERPVYLNEFAAAVMPTTTSEDVKQAIAEAGLPIFEYNSSIEGSRREATLKATEGEGIRFRAIGEIGAANLDAFEEATTRLDNLAAARQMEEAGKDAKSIKLATGWERGADKIWRYEVPDDFNLTDLENRLQEDLNNGIAKAWGIVYPSDLGDLTKAYPDFNVDIMVWVGDEFNNTGEYSPATEGDETAFGKSASIEVKAKTVADIKDVLVHEIQHVIQEKEGFAEGGAVFGLKDKLSAELDKRVAKIKELRAEGRDAEADELMRKSKGLAEAVINNEGDAYGNYRKLSGEVEARNITARLGMSEQERRESLLSETEDVAPEDQIVLMEGLEVNARFSPSLTNLRKAVSKIKSWMTNDTRNDSFEIALPSRVLNKIRSVMGRNFDSHNITANGLAHALKNHGVGGKKLTETSIPIRKEDVELVPYIMTAPDRIEKGSTKNNRESVRFIKNISNGYIVVIEKELDNSADDLETINMWAELSDVSNATRTPDSTSETPTIGRSDSAKIRKDAEDAILSEESKRKNVKSFESNTRFRITPEQDKAYSNAVKAGDMETAQRMVIEAARLAGYDSNSDYQGSLAFNGAAPSGYAYYDTKEERIEAWENGEYEDDQTLGDYKDAGIDISNLGWNLTSPVARRMGNEYTRESIKNLADAINNDSRKIKIYRAVDANVKEDSIRNGDWVTPSRAYAEYHIGLQDWKEGRIIEQEVDIDDIWWDGNDINEWGYNDGKGYAYKNTPNNRKLLAPVTYDNNGNVIPLSERFNPENADIRFRASNENQAIFVSNAARAVDGIKQEKATPEQWLKMIEKAGGLKAGEDKWMGLSDWLKASDKKTLTKAEVLDFVNDHMIVIEEQHYSEGAANDIYDSEVETRDALQQLFDEYVAESEDMNDDMFMKTHYDYAIQKLADGLGYRAWNAPFINDNATIELDYQDDIETLNALRNRLGLTNASGEREINSIRLDYTTEGLTNKHEIALTVPSIEPWNESDDIHFGDAGEGRAVAWIRFGDASKWDTTYQTIEVDEFEKPYKNFRGWDVYVPSNRKGKGDYITSGTLKDGRFACGVFIKDKLVGAYDTFEEAKEAMNAYYRENPEKRGRARKVLVIDEIQSKRHQEGREKGYKSEFKTSEEVQRIERELDAKSERRDELLRERNEVDEEQRVRLAQIRYMLDEVRNVREYDALTQEADKIRAKRENRDAELASLRFEISQLETQLSNAHRERGYRYLRAVPDAPFDKNWHELAMKRMLRYAAENGYDVIAWTKGDQQAERYNIGRAIDSIYYGDFNGNKMVRLTLFGADNQVVEVNPEGKVVAVHSGSMIQEGMNLADIVGKEIALKIMNNEGEKVGDEDYKLSGEGLRVGGEGMKGFYDKILPAFMNKYGKKWGVKVEDVALPGLENGSLTMHSVPVTEEMKASVMEGQVMFRARRDDESAMEFHQAVVDEHKSKHNDIAEMEVFPINEATAKRFGYTIEKLRKLSGLYVSSEDLIAIFANEDETDSIEIEDTIFHESIHKLVDFFDHLKAVGEWMWSVADKYTLFAEFKKHIEQEYSENEYAEEMMCSMLGGVMPRGLADELLSRMPENIKKNCEQIFNEIGYDRRRESIARVLRYDDESAVVPEVVPEASGEDEGRRRSEEKKEGSVRYRAEIVPEVQDEMDAIHASAIVMGNFMKAPNGKDTNLTEEQWLMVRTKGFKNWFGDWLNDPENASKVVDENGEPLVAYHGTPNDFWEFKKTAIGSTNDPGFWGEGFYFTPQEALAYHYSQGGRILPIFLNIRNPYEIKFFTQEFYDHIERFGMFGDKDFSSSRLTSELINIGKDGVIVRRGPDKRDTEYVAFEPSQIKSATDNAGEFSTEKDDVRYRAVPLDATPTDEVVAGGLDITDRQVVELAGNLFDAFPADIRKKITDRMNGNPLNLQSAIFAIPAELAEKESLNDEERAIASIIAREVQSMIDTPMTRDLHISEALWMLYDRVFPTSSYDLVGAAKKAQIKDNLGFSERKLKEKQDDIRYRAATQAEIDAMERNMTAADLYNRDVTSALMRLRESFQDMNRSVQKMVDAVVKKTGKAVKSFEDIMLALNQLSSKNLSDKGNFLRNFLMPMWDAVLAFREKGKTIDDVIRYVMLKHGLERNDVLAQRDARNYYKEAYDKKVRDIEADKSLSDAEKQDKKDKAKDDFGFHVASIQAGTDAKYRELRERDYGAIMALYSDYVDIPDRMPGETVEQFNQRQRNARRPKYTDLAVAEAEAAREVEAFENANRALCDRLWKRINAATKETLKHQYEHNVISKQTYDHVRGMFEFYIPLRGFKEDTAEDIYSYYGKDISTDFANPLIRTKGRTTLAESPFGWIGSMAESAIQMDNKNDAKMRLYYFAVNRPEQNLLTLQKTWYKKTGEDADGRSIWEASYPNITPDMDHNQTRQEIERHDAEMKALAASGQATQKKSELNLRNSVVNISDKAKPEHAITVLINGEEQVMYVNGNPRAAQAINGMLNIDKGDSGLYRILGQKITRWMSRMNTSYNPAFWISNYERDLLFTIMSINVKEDKAYRDMFWSNYVNPAKVTQLLRKYEKGELDLSNPVEKAYKEFADNGGITGFTVLANNEEYDKLLDKYSRDVERSKFIKGAQNALGLIQDFGEGAEQASRFAAYMTSREIGRSIEESIGDAKEVTVNFNRKGSGKAISWEETGNLSYGRYIDSHPNLKWCARVMTMLVSSMAPAGRSVYMFFNASIQGLKAFVSLYKKNPGKAAMWSGAYFGLGFALAALNHMINAIAGGDDDDYLDIPDWERRNNIIIGGNGIYLKWALPQEARPFYAVADIILNKALGRSPDEKFVEEVGRALLEVLPVNPLGEGGFAQAVVPSALSPLYEIWQNTDYKGMPLYRESYWSTGEEPKYDKAFSGTGKVFVEISRLLNEASGGDYAEAGAINIHPAAIEHLIEGYGGGTVTFFNQLLKTLTGNYFTGEWTVRNTPFLNRVVTINDERYRNSHTSDVFKHYENLAKDTKRIYNVYKSNDDVDKIDELMDQKRYDIMKIYERYSKKEERYDDLIRDAEDERERRELMAEQDEIRREMIKEISEL